MIPSISQPITIFEGPDGSGKTTAAKEFAARTGARYVHFASLPSVKDGLARMYVEAMLPAVLGYQPVVLDRSWLSEMPYSVAYREGTERLDKIDIRMIERLAMRCGAVVVQCRNGWEEVKSSFESRSAIEMLDNVDQLRNVYNYYGMVQTHLPTTTYNYRSSDDFNGSITAKFIMSVDDKRYRQHMTNILSAGNADGLTALVGESFANHKNHDAFYQWPFASFSDIGCSRWLTEQLDAFCVPESALLWINADQDLNCLKELKARIIALGTVAAEALLKAGIPHQHVQHPQAWKRFNSRQRYPLIDLIKGAES